MWIFKNNFHNSNPLNRYHNIQTSVRRGLNTSQTLLHSPPHHPEQELTEPKVCKQRGLTLLHQWWSSGEALGWFLFVFVVVWSWFWFKTLGGFSFKIKGKKSGATIWKLEITGIFYQLHHYPLKEKKKLNCTFPRASFDAAALEPSCCTPIFCRLFPNISSSSSSFWAATATLAARTSQASRTSCLGMLKSLLH